MSFDPKTSAKQTAYKGACELTAALVTSGLIDSIDKAKATMEEIASQVFTSLEGTFAADVPAGRSGAGATSSSDISPGDWTFNFGKHDGKTIAEVAQEDMGYLEWLTEKDWNKARDKARNFAKAYLDSVKAGM